MRIKSIVFFTIFLAFSANCVAQSGLYFRLGGGYSWAIAKDAMGTNTIEDTATGALSYSVNLATLGKGGNGCIEIGYRITPYVGIELGFEYLYGAQQKAVSIQSSGLNVNAIAYTRQFRLAPGLVVSTGNTLVQGYARGGFLIPLTGVTTKEITTTLLGFGNPIENFEKTKNYGAFSLGFYGALGVAYPINDLITVFAECRGVNLRIRQKSEETVEYVTNGDDLLSTLKPWRVHIDYLQKLPNTANVRPGTGLAPADPEKPSETLSTTSPYSSLGLNIGVKITIPKTGKKSFEGLQ